MSKGACTRISRFWMWVLPVTGFRNFTKQITSQTLLKIFEDTKKFSDISIH
jgi:hypothetical protein